MKRRCAGVIPKNFIQDLLNRLDIVDVVERYVPLKKAGANYVACCPFHNEKSPSFTVSQTKQFYHCFGCGAHGTAIGFVMEHAGLGYVDAIEELALDLQLAARRIGDDGEDVVSLFRFGPDLAAGNRERDRGLEARNAGRLDRESRLQVLRVEQFGEWQIDRERSGRSDLQGEPLGQ